MAWSLCVPNSSFCLKSAWKPIGMAIWIMQFTFNLCSTFSWNLSWSQ